MGAPGAGVDGTVVLMGRGATWEDEGLQTAVVMTA